MRKDPGKILISALLAVIVAGAASCSQPQASVSSASPEEPSSESTDTVGGSENDDEDSAASLWDDTDLDASSGGQAEAVTVDPKTADYSKVDITIPPDSGEEIVNFTNDMLAGKYDGKIVKCTGRTSRRMSGNAMLQEQTDGTSRGFTWYIVDSENPDDYPPEDAVAEITGVVGVGDWDVRYLYVLPENIVILDGEGESAEEPETAASDDTAGENLTKVGSYDNLRVLAEAYYSGSHDGYVPSVIDFEPQEDGTLAIHLYDIVDDHTATLEWYYIDPQTLKGTDLLGNTIDMDMSAGDDMAETFSVEPDTIEPAPWSPIVMQRQVMLDYNEFFGVRYLGWIDPSITGLDDKVREILRSTGTAEDFEFTAEMPADRFVSTEGGQELYLVIPFDESGSVYVVPQAAPDEPVGEAEPLYHSEDGEPFLLKCNVSEIYADVKVIFFDINGEHSEWYPGLSGMDGSVITTNDTGKNVHDFTDYGNISGYVPAVG